MSSVTKTVCEQYDVRGDRPSEWATIFVTAKDGMLSIQSDYGEYGYRWSSPGMAFKAFIVSIDTAYLIGKIAPGRDFDDYKTIENLKREIVKLRRGGEIGKEAARECMDAADELSAQDASDFVASFQSFDCLDKAFPAVWEWPIIETVPNRQATAFCERLWPVFIAALKAEISVAAA